MQQINVVKFEADVQRQHARYKLPLNCVINGYRYKSLDWSIAGVGVATGNETFKVGKTLPLDLEFPFDGFTFTLKMKGEIRHNDPTTGRTGLQFVETEASHRRTLRFVLDSYLSGELLTANELLDFSNRSTTVRERSKAKDAKDNDSQFVRTMRGAGRFGATALLCGAVGVFLWSSAYQHLYVFDANAATITTVSKTIVAPASGTVTNLVTGPVVPGQPIATILTPNEQSVTIAADCKCIATSLGKTIDSPVSSGDQLLDIAVEDAAPYIVTIVNRDRLMSLYSGARISVQTPQGTAVSEARISRLPKLSEGDLTSQSLFPVYIEAPAEELAPFAGSPVTVSFDTGHWSLKTIKAELSGWMGKMLNKTVATIHSFASTSAKAKKPGAEIAT